MAGKPWDALTKRLRSLPIKGLEGVAFWLAVWFFLLGLFRLGGSEWGGLFAVLQVLDAIAFFGVGIPLALRFVRRRLLWSLRSRLILTYLLFGLAPVILGVTLAFVFAYVAAGQFAIHLVDTRLLAQRDRMAGQNGNRFGRMMQALGIAPSQQAEIKAGDVVAVLPAQRESNPIDPSRIGLRQESRVFFDGVMIEASEATRPEGQGRETRTPLGLPAWASALAEGHFAGLVLDGEDIYLVAITQQKLANHHVVSLISSIPVDEVLMDTVAEGLGRAGLFAFATDSTKADAPVVTIDESGVGAQKLKAKRAPRLRTDSAFGGAAPEAANLADVQVRFLSTVGVTNWDTGLVDNIPVEVDSRPSLLYKQLFGGSLGGVITSVYRIGIIVLIVLFALLETLALYLAVKLGRTITGSVANLYEATQSIDRGDLGHRIAVTGCGPVVGAWPVVQQHDGIAAASACGAAGEGAVAERTLDCAGGAGESVSPCGLRPGEPAIAWSLSAGTVCERRLLRLHPVSQRGECARQEADRDRRRHSARRHQRQGDFGGTAYGNAAFGGAGVPVRQ